MGNAGSVPKPPELPPSLLKKAETVANTELYVIRVYTGKHVDSGSQANISYTLIGEEGKSKPQPICINVDMSMTPEGYETMEQLEDGTHRECFTYATGESLGEIGAVVFLNSGRGLHADFEVHKVVVEKVVAGGLESATFWQQWVVPCYGWVPGRGKRHFFEAHPKLPHQTPHFLKKLRAKELNYQQGVYNYSQSIMDGQTLTMPNPCAATRLDELPWDERPPASCDGELPFHAAKLIRGRGLSKHLGDPAPWKALTASFEPGTLMGEVFSPYEMTTREAAREDDPELLRGFPAPDLLRGENEWIENDYEFVRQLLQGVNPHILRVCTEVPEELDADYITRQLAQMEVGSPPSSQIIRPGRSLEAEAAVHRLMVLDYSWLRQFQVPEQDPGGGPPSGEGGGRTRRKYAGASPMCLVYIMEDPDTQEHVPIPVAIKLQPYTSDAPIFTPNCYEYDWLIAKIFVANADAQVHMVKSLYLETYAVMEPYALSLNRQLSSFHPVFRLLRPFLRNCIAGNVTARRWLLGPTGFLAQCFSTGPSVDKMLEHLYYQWKLEDTGLPQDLLRRGFDGNEKVPEYPYRDDGMLVWGAVVDFVLEYLQVYYESDYEVMADEELQSWWSEATTVGHNGLVEDEEVQGIKDLDRLSMICVLLIWNTTALHSSRAHGCYEYYAFPPNRPTILHLPPMHRLDAGTLEKFFAMMPSRGETVLVQAFMTLISEVKDHSTMLGSPDEEWFTDQIVVTAFEKFRSNLRHVEAIVQVRNEKRKVPYHYMRPETITQAIGM